MAHEEQKHEEQNDATDTVKCACNCGQYLSNKEIEQNRQYKRGHRTLPLAQRPQRVKVLNTSMETTINDLSQRIDMELAQLKASVDTTYKESDALTSKLRSINQAIKRLEGIKFAIQETALDEQESSGDPA